jgi:hypothetical protein
MDDLEDMVEGLRIQLAEKPTPGINLAQGTYNRPPTTNMPQNHQALPFTNAEFQTSKPPTYSYPGLAGYYAGPPPKVAGMSGLRPLHAFVNHDGTAYSIVEHPPG